MSTENIFTGLHHLAGAFARMHLVAKTGLPLTQSDAESQATSLVCTWLSEHVVTTCWESTGTSLVLIFVALSWKSPIPVSI